MAPVLGSAQPAYPACPLNRGNLKELKENLPVIYVWLMSLRSVPLWQKLRTDWPRRITGRRQGYGPAGKELKENDLVIYVIFCG
jgi:hypothetical protein